MTPEDRPQSSDRPAEEARGLALPLIRRSDDDDLRRTAARFRAIVEATTTMTVTTAPDGSFAEPQQSWEAYTGQAWEQHRGVGWLKALHPDDRKGGQESFARSLATRTWFEGKLRVFHAASGSHRWCVLRAAPVLDERGELLEWFGIGVDIHPQQTAEIERARLEERLRASEAHLRTLVEELEEANRQKNQFLAMLSHELRNPLAPIRNATEVLRVGAAVPETIEWARAVVDRQVRHLARLVDDLLDVSRISEGKIVLQREPIELLSTVAAAIEIVRPEIDARRQELRLELPREPVRLDADPTRLAQVIANLLDNASKFSEPGAAIELEAALAGGELVLRVGDRGIGIAPEMLDEIFGLFTQADRSLARSQGGLGIGLTLVRRLVELHGGTVTVASEGLGRGSEFTVRLPAACEHRPPPAPIANRERTPAARRVLVVDDTVDAAESLATLLELSGHEVEIAHDGAAALERVERFTPEVALVDIGLPGMDGYELAGRLRERLGRSVLLVAVTGYGRPEDRARSKAAGFDLHLVKPIDLDELVRLLADRPAGASPAERPR